MTRDGRVPPAADRPLYARLLRLRHLRPSGPLCFALLEGTLALGALFALAELIPWWSVPALPAAVAAMVKLNDVIAGTVGPPADQATRPPVRRVHRARRVPSGAPTRVRAVARVGGPAVQTTGPHRDL